MLRCGSLDEGVHHAHTLRPKIEGSRRIRRGSFESPSNAAVLMKDDFAK